MVEQDPSTKNMSKREPVTVSIHELRVPLKELAELPKHSPDHHLEQWIAKHLQVPKKAVLNYNLQRRSLDARKKPQLQFIYQLSAQIDGNHQPKESKGTTVETQAADENESLYQLPLLSELPKSPIVVGTGPSGIMAAYLLALHGCKPIVIDRGFDVEKRGKDIDDFHESRDLNTESNYLFGEGGAGTYSDGKLYTRVKDRRMRFLLEAFVAGRAPKHILWRHHPHIGSDILPHMAKRLRQQIEEWGGTFRWGTAVKDIIKTGDRCTGVILENGEQLEAPLVLMGIGHSARQLIMRLIKHNLTHKAKGYQLGCRIEHDQQLIDKAQYGYQPPEHLLGAAEYNLVSRPPKHLGVQNTTTFCMCPGGEIIAATSDKGQISTNGMSLFARSSPFANAGLIVNQPVDQSSNGLVGFEILDRIEQAAFAAGGSDYGCPAQSVRSFLYGEPDKKVGKSSYRMGIVPGRLDHILPSETADALKAALKYYNRVIPGFGKQGQLVGVETRVSSPVRFERNPETLASSLDGLYLMGEGAGYAGGIISAALDGLRIAECILTGKATKR